LKHQAAGILTLNKTADDKSFSESKLAVDPAAMRPERAFPVYGDDVDAYASTPAAEAPVGATETAPDIEMLLAPETSMPPATWSPEATVAEPPAIFKPLPTVVRPSDATWNKVFNPSVIVRMLPAEPATTRPFSTPNVDEEYTSNAVAEGVEAVTRSAPGLITAFPAVNCVVPLLTKPPPNVMPPFTTSKPLFSVTYPLDWTYHRYNKNNTIVNQPNCSLNRLRVVCLP
jgi:hypothetical protein